MEDKIKIIESDISGDIAVVGIGCKLPGAVDYTDFWENLAKGVDSVREVPNDPCRWDINQYYSDNINEENKSISKWCGIIDDIDKFDNQFFNVSPREAKSMDPQQRLLLQETWHCIEDSGISVKRLQDLKTSVYIGVMATDYHQEYSSDDTVVDSYAGLGNYQCILANRLSYYFNFKGTSMAIDAACASSLVAIHNAKQSLVLGESDYAIAGGVNLNFHPWKYISFSKARMLSPTGRCKTFDKDADGYVPGEGIAVVLLQRLSDAIKENNHIYGIIKGSAVNHGGRTKSITAPRVGAQVELILSAYNNSGFPPETVNYMEAHGTGTSLGDPIEIESLTQAFREYIPRKVDIDVFEKRILKKITQAEEKVIDRVYSKDKTLKRYVLNKNLNNNDRSKLVTILRRIEFIHSKNQFCTIGSVKTNIGHLEAAAGIAGFIKVLMMMKYKQIPSNLHLSTPNPIIDFQKTPFEIAGSLKKWTRVNSSIPLRAGVSSFGFGGVNSHVLIEEYNSVRTERNKEILAYSNFFLLSCNSEKSMAKLIEKWKVFVDSEDFSVFSLQDITQTLLNGREQMQYRIGFRVNDKDELKDKIKDISTWQMNNTESTWCLRVGSIENRNIDKIRNMLDNNRLFRNNYNSLLSILKGLRSPFVLSKKIEEERWDEKTSEIMSYVISYAFYKTLMDVGLTISVICSEGNIISLLTGLSLSGIIKTEDALSILINNNIDYSKIVFSRPIIPFYDYTYNKTAMPFHFKKDYLVTLVNELREHNQLLGEIIIDNFVSERAGRKEENKTVFGSILLRNNAITKEQLTECLSIQKRNKKRIGEILISKSYCTHDDIVKALQFQTVVHNYVEEIVNIDKARQLNESQWTFKKYLDEWDVVLKKYGNDMENLLHNDKLSVSENGMMPYDKTLLLVIILSSLKKLNQKWDLEENIEDEIRLYELVDLIVDNVISKEDVIELFLSESPDYDKIFHSLNRRQRYANMSNCYTFIRQFNKHLEQEIPDVRKYLIETIKSESIIKANEIAYTPVEEVSYLEIGNIKHPVPYNSYIRYSEVNDFDELFKEILLKYWLMGGKLDWELLSKDQPYKKVQLPTYPFDIEGKSFWLDKRKEKVRMPEQKSLYYYRPKWIEKETDFVSDESKRYALIFTKDDEISNNLINKIKDRYSLYSKVTCGKSEHSLKVTDKSSYDETYDVLMALKSQLTDSIDVIDIYYLWSISDDKGADYDNIESDCIRPIFNIAKAIMNGMFKQRINITYFTNDSQVILENDSGKNFFYGFLPGFIKSCSLENPRIISKTIDILSCGSINYESIINDCMGSNENKVIAYRGKRYIISYEKFIIDNNKNDNILKPDGVYIIIGGSGGIGLKLSEFIASASRNTVIITGRSKISTELEKKIRIISEKTGSLVKYYSIDIMDYDKTKDFISEVKSEHKKINGVIHAGGVLKDKYLISKDYDSFNSVIAPKIKGTMVLDKLLNDNVSDFVILFSSIVSVIGNEGQTDYAAANSFMDSYAHFKYSQRKGLIIKSLNWSLWADGGMGLSEAVIKQLGKRGLSLLHSRDVFRDFQNIISNDNSQIIISASMVPELEGRTERNYSQSYNNEKVPEELINKYIIKLFSDRLQVPIDVIDTKESLFSLGLDSILIKEITTELESAFVNISPTLLFECPTIDSLIGTLQTLPILDKSKFGGYANNENKIDVKEIIIKIISEKLQVSMDDIDINSSFFSMGVDSILIKEITVELEKYFNDLSQTILFEYPDINQLAKHLETKNIKIPNVDLNTNPYKLQLNEKITDSDLYDLFEKLRNDEIDIDYLDKLLENNYE